MDPPILTKPLDKVCEFHATSTHESSLDPNADACVKLVTSKNSDNKSTIIIDSSSNNGDLTVTPAFPNFPTDEELIIQPESTIRLEPSNDASVHDINSSSSTTNTSRPSQQTLQILDELKYLLKPTNSLANPQAVQEADSAIKRRTVQFDEDILSDADRLLYEGLTPHEAKSLGAAERRSIAARGQRVSSISQFSERSRSTHSAHQTHSHSQISSTIKIAKPERRAFLDHLSGLIWAFLAAYAFSIIIFLTKICEIDLVFGFFLQMFVQLIAFGIYAFYKGYNLLGPSEHQIATICRALLIGFGALTSFLAYYYITLPDLSAIRQTQIMFTIILSMIFLHGRVTISRIIACVLIIIAIILLIRPRISERLFSLIFNSTDYKSSRIPYSSSWNSIIGISFALCTAISYSIASIMNKIYFSTQQLHNTVLCFWSALSALTISSILLYVTHFVLKDGRSFPHDWRLFVGIALALASIFVFIANQKAIKRERSSIVALIYSTDIVLALILQNIFTHIKSDKVVILGRIFFYL
ncbi:unnamed protein product [Rotaria sp. Silwood2]|nr:unnamed protein product [Rotaria sp. Silwood2]CAF2714627.1 unnamed protein product [Rotaria sp. Silwood2]CAF2885102.1 unnamed protein product [Rotaria sp. Silwood2]CAF3036773.1 unnamed protein product [Rotaria sp. Silwood2]CAF3852039.1 unnamed protein product [Rotaria sp. Silwood2]